MEDSALDLPDRTELLNSEDAEDRRLLDEDCALDEPDDAAELDPLDHPLLLCEYRELS